MIHAHCTYGDPRRTDHCRYYPRRGHLVGGVLLIFRDIFSALCVSPLRCDRYTDCDGSRLLLRYKLYTRYNKHIPSIVVGRNYGLRSFICL